MDRPRLITYNLASADGRLTIAPGVNLMAGDERWVALVEDSGDPYAWVREEHRPEVLLEGSGSFLSPAHADLVPFAATTPAGSGDETYLPADVVKVPGRRWFTVVDGHGRVDLAFTEWPGRAWAGWHAFVLTSHAAPAAHLAGLRERGIPYLVVGADHVDLPRAVGLLHDLLSVRTVVATGGGRLGGALLRHGLVDEVDVEVLPALIGGLGTPALFDAEPLGPGEWPTRLDLLDAETLVGGRVRLRYRVVR